jgi:hypothetical protein
MRTRLLLPAALLAASTVVLPSGAAPSAGPKLSEGVGRDIRPIARIDYVGGTDLEFTTIKGRDYAVAASEHNRDLEDAGLRMIDITNPRKPKQVGFLECSVSQNDVQVRGTTVLMGVDYDEDDAACFRQLKIAPARGLLVISVANPRKPRAVGFVKVPKGVHNSTWHPGGRYAYVSDSDRFNKHNVVGVQPGGSIFVVDLANPRKPKVVKELTLMGDSSHDLTFNRKGTRAYSAALDHSLIIDTTKPAAPKIITVINDPAVYIHHGADPTPDGKYLYITDEQMGGGTNYACNVGGVHVFDISDEKSPKLIGFFTPVGPEAQGSTQDGGANKNCTAHVLDFTADGTSFVQPYYAGGIWVVSDLGAVGFPPAAAFFVGVDADTWSAKSYRSKQWIFSSDMVRGFEVWEWKPGLGAVDTRTPATRAAAARGALDFRPSTLAPGTYCFTAKTA